MTTLDPTRPHIVYGPHDYADGRWWGGCTCGDQFYAATADGIREQWAPHQEAQRRRLSEVERRGSGVG